MTPEETREQERWEERARELNMDLGRVVSFGTPIPTIVEHLKRRTADAIRDFVQASACQEHGSGSMAFHCSECGKRWQVAARRAAKEAGWTEGVKAVGDFNAGYLAQIKNPYTQEGGS